MKKLMLIVAALGFMATTSFAQNGSASMSSTPTGTTASSTSKAANAKYICPKCKAVSDKPGTCSKCNAKLVKEGTYYCPGCGATSAKAGKCTKCNMDMVKMTASAK